MPVVLRYKGFQFYFFANEGNPRELPHIHVRRAEATAKFWLDPVSVADSYGFNAPTLRELAAIVEQHKDLFERTWHEFFG